MSTEPVTITFSKISQAYVQSKGGGVYEVSVYGTIADVKDVPRLLEAAAGFQSESPVSKPEGEKA